MLDSLVLWKARTLQDKCNFNGQTQCITIWLDPVFKNDLKNKPSFEENKHNYYLIWNIPRMNSDSKSYQTKLSWSAIQWLRNTSERLHGGFQRFLDYSGGILFWCSISKNYRVLKDEVVCLLPIQKSNTEYHKYILEVDIMEFVSLT